MLGQIPGNPSLLSVAGDIPIPQIEPNLGGTPYFIPVHSVQMLPATPEGSTAPIYPVPEKDFVAKAIDWANANQQGVMIASGLLIAMILFGKRKR